MQVTSCHGCNIPPIAYIALPVPIVPHSRHRAVRCSTGSMPIASRDRHDFAPAAYIALAFRTSACGYYRPIRMKPNRPPPTCRDRHDTPPFPYIALAMSIPPRCQHRAVLSQTDRMSVPRVRRHMDIAGRNRLDIAPIGSVARAVFWIACRYDRAIRSETNGMSMTCRNRIHIAPLLFLSRYDIDTEPIFEQLPILDVIVDRGLRHDAVRPLREALLR